MVVVRKPCELVTVILNLHETVIEKNILIYPVNITD